MTFKLLDDLERVGGHPVLDFVNTVDAWSATGPGADYLQSYEDVVRWHCLTGLIGHDKARDLKGGSGAARAAGLRQVRHFRKSLHALFHAVATRQAPAGEPLKHLNEVLRRTIRWRQLVASGGDIVCQWDFAGAPPGAIVAPVAWQAVELLEHGEPGRIKECPEPNGCGWLFLDSSRNRSRSWCSMKTCGNNAKVKRYRQRRRRNA